MKLAASVIVRNELGRYLEPCIGHLLDFCDEVRVLDDHSTDGSFRWLLEQGERVQPLRSGFESAFFRHEGKARQMLFDWTLEGSPTHVLAIDADEFVADGAAVRQAIEQPGGRVWTLDMEEVWQAYDECLCVREDGGWRTHPVPILYAVPARRDRSWRIANRQLACGREPMAVARLARHARPTGTEVLHFGWTDERERAARHHRYAVADGGRFHQGAHLRSILAPNEQTLLRGRDWPAALEPVRAQILDRCTGAVA